MAVVSFLALGTTFLHASAYEPLKDTSSATTESEALPQGTYGWISGNKYNVEMTLNNTEGTITNTASDWYGDAATYRFKDVISLAQNETLTFSFDFVRTGSNTAQTIALVGTTQAIVIGHGNYETNGDVNLHVGISNNVAHAETGAGAHGYGLGGSMNQGFIANVDIAQTLENGMKVATNSISGTIAWDGDSYCLNLISSSAETDSYLICDLGTAFDIRDLVFTFDGKDAPTTISNLMIQIVPEPSAFGLFAGVGAFLLVALRRRRR